MLQKCVLPTVLRQALSVPCCDVGSCTFHKQSSAAVYLVLLLRILLSLALICRALLCRGRS